jgi:hypothetical protein
MKTATRGRFALCLAIGLLLCLAGPLHAAPGALELLFKPESIAQSGGSPLAAGRNLGNPKPTAAPPIVAAEDLNEADRALQDETPRPSMAVASKDQATPRRTVAMAGSDHSVWNETSLIGKIFVGLGTLLMVASTARMFMA